MGGLLSSAVLTLLVLPYVNLGVEGAASWVRRVWRRSAGRKGTKGRMVDAPVLPSASQS